MVVYCPLRQDTSREGRADFLACFPNGMRISQKLCLALQARGDCEGVVCENRVSEGLEGVKNRRSLNEEGDFHAKT